MFRYPQRSAKARPNTIPRKSPSRWSTVCWAIVMCGALAGLLYLHFAPDLVRLSPHLSTSATHAPANETVIKTAQRKLRQWSHSAWALLPAKRQAQILQNRMWILGVIAFLAWSALLHNRYRKARRGERQTAQLLSEFVQASNDAAQQVSNAADNLTRMETYARTRAESAEDAVEKGSQATQNALVSMDKSRYQMQDLLSRFARLTENARALRDAGNRLNAQITHSKIVSLNAIIQANQTGETDASKSTANAANADGAPDALAVHREMQRLTEDAANRATEITELAQHFEKHLKRATAAVQDADEEMAGGAVMSVAANRALDEIARASAVSLTAFTRIRNNPAVAGLVTDEAMDNVDADLDPDDASKAAELLPAMLNAPANAVDITEHPASEVITDPARAGATTSQVAASIAKMRAATRVLSQSLSELQPRR